MRKERGFISWLILLIIALALLKYFLNWSIFDAMESERGRETVSYIRDVLNIAWSYVRTPVMFVWQKALELLRSR
ncbi:MAG: hypothetical protein UV94_C0020G0005 [Parcubacteria group bacterium GW2011_GWC1_43_30]|nr:MAG: hypothetical protein UV94_C0020G0005 [Parcubacteria group bacterium GW2011_GWC1_43_30]